jgi:hypothetical protein
MAFLKKIIANSKKINIAFSDKKQKIGGLVLASLGYFYNTQ